MKTKILVNTLSLMMLRKITIYSFKHNLIKHKSISTKLFSTTSKNTKGGGRISNAVTDEKLLSKTSSESSSRTRTTLETNPVKGTRDFFPEELRQRTWLFGKWRSIAAKFGFSEYDSPVLENEALYTRKAGEEVTGQLYNFEDKGGRRISLRPEMTPSLARMVMSKKGSLPLPIKWYSIPQCWRYERMTRGRRREHYQWNMDIWGVGGVKAEIELLTAMVEFFKSVGLSSQDVGIKVNSRVVIADVLTELGIPEEKFAATCVLVDKLEKMPLEAIQGDLEALGLSVDVVKQLTSILSAKSFETLIPQLPSNSKAIPQLTELFSLAQAYKIQDWIQFDASIVRGLAYYTGIVFEAFDRSGNLRAIAGGGRYDKLLESFGGDPTPAVGFGFGDAVIVELLKDKNLLPDFTATDIDTVVYAMEDSLYKDAVEAAMVLRQYQNVDVILEEGRKPKWIFKNADRNNVRYVLMFAAREFENGEVSIKDLVLGDQENIKIDQLEQWALSKQEKIE